MKKSGKSFQVGKILNFLKMKKLISFISLVVLSYSCKNEAPNVTEKVSDKAIEVVNKDTLSIYMNMPAKSAIGINAWKKPYDEFYLKFENETEKDTVILEKLPIIYDNNVMTFATFIDGENQEFIMLNNFFIANEDHSNLKLEFDGKTVHYTDKNASNFLTDSIYEAYRKIETKFSKKKTSGLKKELDSINSYYMQRTENDKLNAHFNDIHYLQQLQTIDPTNRKINEYLKNTTGIGIGNSEAGLLQSYFKNRADVLDYGSLNKNGKRYLELLSIGAYRFLKIEKNKGDSKYEPALNWFKTTDFYKRDSSYIKEQIIPLSKRQFKNNLTKLTLTDITSNQTSISEIVKQHNSPYYLIDFWATWCKPCIKGINTMNKMNFPESVKVISLSIDKQKDITKWKSTTEKLNQKITYWIDKDIPENQDFLDFAKIQSIPRYILIDKNLNLIDQAFYHPQDPGFKPGLSTIMQYKENNPIELD